MRILYKIKCATPDCGYHSETLYDITFKERMYSHAYGSGHKKFDVELVGDMAQSKG